MDYYNKFLTKKNNSLQYSIQKVITRLQTAFQIKERTCFNKTFFQKGPPISLCCGVQRQPLADVLRPCDTDTYFRNIIM